MSRSVTIFTSIAPRNVEAQLEALATWRGFAERIVTVNERREAPLLGDLPDWIDRHAFDDDIPYPRLYVRLAKLAEAMRAAPTDRAVFINSDISLAAPDELRQAIDSDDSGLLFASRTDTDEAGAPISVYTDGFDFFCFRPEHAGHMGHPQMFIGLPWWDFLVPLEFVRHGLVATRLPGHLIHHRQHPQKWDRAAFLDKSSVVLRHVTNWPGARALVEEETKQFTWQVNTFLNSKLMQGAARAGQKDALDKLIALWRRVHAHHPSKNAWKTEVWLVNRLYYRYTRMAEAFATGLRGSPTIYRLARVTYRTANWLIPQYVKKTPASVVHDILVKPKRDAEGQPPGRADTV
ncbi:MAG: hypothetical protein NW205_13940 [Hyphomicrobiaceae bacterium]|nr:hypothetical protein [Hyphomicrobiaceae bacterium]